MGKLFLSTLIVFAAFGGLAQADVPTKDINFSDVFVPADQTTNKDATVVASGMFPNSCYRMKGADVYNKSALEHEVKLMATVSQSMCLMVIVPFTKEINLGRLSPGEHTLRFTNGDDTYFERKLVIQ
jgi:hypothetical protein